MNSNNIFYFKMAGFGELSSQILNVIQSHGSLQLRDIIKQVRADKKTINQQLYQLRNRGYVVKLVESPPTWGIPVPLSRSNSEESNKSVKNTCQEKTEQESETPASKLLEDGLTRLSIKDKDELGDADGNPFDINVNKDSNLGGSAHSDENNGSAEILNNKVQQPRMKPTMVNTRDELGEETEEELKGASDLL